MELSSKLGEATEFANRTSLMYEEIGDVKSSFTYTQNAIYQRSTTVHRLASDPVPEVPTGVEQPESHDDYELMQTAEYHSMEKAYKVKQCSAYGIASSTIRSCELNWSHDPSKSQDTNPTKVHDSRDQEENTSQNGVTQESHSPNNSWDMDQKEKECPPGHSGASDLNDPCACETDPKEICHAPGTASEKSSDLDDSTGAGKSTSEKSCDMDDPAQAEKKKAAASSEKSNDAGISREAA